MNGMYALVDGASDDRIGSGFPFDTDDPEAIELTVKAKGQGRGVSARVICNAILCSVGSEHQDQLAKRLTMLPVLMVKGTAAVTRYVIAWLQDSQNKAYSFNQRSTYSLKWF